MRKNNKMNYSGEMYPDLALGLIFHINEQERGAFLSLVIFVGYG